MSWRWSAGSKYVPERKSPPKLVELHANAIALTESTTRNRRIAMITNLGLDGKQVHQKSFRIRVATNFTEGSRMQGFAIAGACAMTMSLVLPANTFESIEKT
jgi:hypothetical protein